MATKSIKVPKSYTVYIEYLDRLKGFYDIINNSQYKHQILPNGTIYYKDISQAKWHKITPPKFINRVTAIENLIKKRDILMNDILTLEVVDFLKPTDDIAKTQIEKYNEMINDIGNIDTKIKNLEGVQTDDMEALILSKVQERKLVLDTLAELLQIRHDNYTFTGSNIVEYNKWYETWKLSEQHTIWSDTNKVYYQNLLKLNAIDTEILENLDFLNKLEEFAKYEMVELPEYEFTSQSPPAKTAIIIPPKLIVPGTETKTSTNVPKVSIKVKACKPDDVKATQPGFLCSPDSGIWVKINGDAGNKILLKYPLDKLKISTGTDITPYKSLYQSTNLPSSIPIIVSIPSQPIASIPITPAPSTPTAVCKDTHQNANIPGYVCSPQSKVWVVANGDAAKKLYTLYATDQLKWSTGTNIADYQSLMNIETKTAPKIKITTKPKVETLVPKIETPAPVQLPAKIKIQTKPKLETAKVEVKELPKAEVKELLKAKVKESKKEQYLDIINKGINANDKAVGKLTPALIGPILKLLIDSDVPAQWPSIVAFFKLNKDSDAYKKLLSGGVNYATAQSVMTNIYKSIKDIK